MAAVVGIDLGTTYSAIATLDERGRAYTIPNRDGERLTPSAVYLGADEAVVGQAALDVAMEMPEQVATLIKRRMGYPDYGRSVSGRDWRPESLSALILRKLVQDAERQIGPIRQAVITVPAYFDETRRRATQDAGRIAGLEVLDILDEPSAAALAYSFRTLPSPEALNRDRQETVLVYDLGGGTFDVTLVRIEGKRFQSLAIEGDVRLGGKDWDDRIVDAVAREFERQHGSDPRTQAQSAVLLQAAAERSKRVLSRLPQTTVTCAHGGQVLSYPLSREHFEALTRDLLTRTRLTVQQLMRRAQLSWQDVDRILMVGGASHMPMTGAMLRELSGQEPDHTLAVSEVVAQGAALHAGIQTLKQADALRPMGSAWQDLADVVEISVSAHSLGVEIRHQGQKINDILVGRNTQLPASASRVYRTVKPDQRRVRVVLLQGDAPQADACIRVGECWIEELPAGLPEGSPVEVCCTCSTSALVEVEARDLTSQRGARAEFHRAGGLSEADLQAESRWVRGMKVS